MRIRLAVWTALAVPSIAAFVACANQTFDASSSDASTEDASATDANTAEASPSDSGVIGVDPCHLDAGYVFCDDFDQADLSGTWNTSGPCVVPTIDDSDFVSPSHSARASASSPVVGQTFRTCTNMAAGIGDNVLVTTCEADVKIETPPDQQFSFFQITDLFPGEPFHAITLIYSGPPAGNQPISLGEAENLADGGSTASLVTVKAGAAAVTNRWFHIALTVDYNSHEATATIAGVTQTLPLKLVPSGSHASMSAFLNVGYSFLGDSGVATMRYDNVLCTAHP